jgi:hypothetical protein
MTIVVGAEVNGGIGGQAASLLSRNGRLGGELESGWELGDDVVVAYARSISDAC